MVSKKLVNISGQCILWWLTMGFSTIYRWADCIRSHLRNFVYEFETIFVGAKFSLTRKKVQEIGLKQITNQNNTDQQ